MPVGVGGDGLRVYFSLLGLCQFQDTAQCGHALFNQGEHFGAVIELAQISDHALASCYIGNMKGVGRIYQQTFVDTYGSASASTRPS
jgi:hypothetical protein